MSKGINSAASLGFVTNGAKKKKRKKKNVDFVPPTYIFIKMRLWNRYFPVHFEKIFSL